MMHITKGFLHLLDYDSFLMTVVNVQFLNSSFHGKECHSPK